MALPTIQKELNLKVSNALWNLIVLYKGAEAFEVYLKKRYKAGGEYGGRTLLEVNVGVHDEHGMSFFMNFEGEEEIHVKPFFHENSKLMLSDFINHNIQRITWKEAQE